MFNRWATALSRSFACFLLCSAVSSQHKMLWWCERKERGKEGINNREKTDDEDEGISRSKAGRVRRSSWESCVSEGVFLPCCKYVSMWCLSVNCSLFTCFCIIYHNAFNKQHLETQPVISLFH